jgi:hypothetical protein
MSSPFMSKPQEVKMAKKGLLLGILALALVFGFVLAGCATASSATGSSELVIQREDGLMHDLNVYVDDENKAYLPYSRTEVRTAGIVVPNGRHTVRVQINNLSSEITVEAASNRIIFATTYGDSSVQPNKGTGLQVQNRGTGSQLQLTKVSETALDN